MKLSDEPGLIDFLKSRNIDIVVDVGANEGQFGKELRKMGYRGRIISFEPLAESFERLKAASDKDENWTIINSAVGDTDGDITINRTRSTVYSSINEVSSYGLARDNGMSVISRDVVPIMRLDGMEDLQRAEQIFLKVDTQGYEKQVLTGASGLLPIVLGIQLELPVKHLYDGVWDFMKALEFVGQIGYCPAQFRTVCGAAEVPASAIEFDCVFRKTAA